MKRKWLMLGSAIGISSVVLITSGFTALASTSGYDAYKSALKNTKTLHSVSVQAEAQLKDNGSSLFSGSGSLKADLAGKADSASATLQGQGGARTVNFYKQDGKTIVKESGSDVYYVEQDGKKKGEQDKEKLDGQVPQEVENVIDALVGNLKDYVTLNTQTDGTKAISLHLTDTQLPAVAQAFGALAIKQADTEQGRETNDDAAQSGKAAKNGREGLKSNLKDVLKLDLPQLATDIKIDAVDLKAVINADNYIQHQEADITVSGKDAAGAAHQVVLHLNGDFSGFNSTTPDKVDLTGKTVQTVQNHNKDRSSKE